MSIITFTTKKNEPIGGHWVSMDTDPVLVEIKRVNVSTDKGEKIVSKIFFHPNSTITKDDIKKTLEIKGEKVSELTFKIEIDKEIKAEEDSSPFTAGMSSSVPAGTAKKEPPNDNTLKNGMLHLRDYSLDKITKETNKKKPNEEEEEDTGDGLVFTCSQCNKETPTSEMKEHGGNKYCSDKCINKSQEKPPKEECPQCNQKFTNLPISGSQGKSYCSDNCKQEAEKVEEPEKDTPEPEKYNPQDDIDKAEQQRKAQETQNRTELDSLIQKGKGQDSPNDLKTTLEQIEQKNSTKAYQDLKSEIDSLKNKLNNKLSLSEVQQNETTKLNAFLAKNNLKKEDLDAETQTKLTNISNAPDLSTLTTHSEEISTKIGQKGAEKKFESILAQIKTIKPNDNSKKQELKTQLEKLMKEDDRFVKEFIKNHKSQIENALSQLTQQKKKDNSNPKKDSSLSTKQKVGLGVAIGGGAFLIIGLVIFLVRRKKSPPCSL